MTDDVAIVTAGRPEILVAWFRAFLRSPSRGKFHVHVGNDGSFPGLFLSRLAALPDVSVFDYALPRGLFPGEDEHHAGWASKPTAMLHCPTRWCLWLDHDCEVLGDLSPIAEHAIATGKWLSAPFYSSFGTARYEGTRITQNGLCVVDTQSPQLRRWRDIMPALRDSNDETALLSLYGGYPSAAAADFCDLYRPAWYASPDCFLVRRKGWSAAATAMQSLSPPPVVRHWTSARGKQRFRDLHPGHRFRMEPQ